MDIAAGIGTALSNALRVDEIQTQLIQELRRLQALAIPVPARSFAGDAANSKLHAENASLLQHVAAQELSILKLRHQACALTKCASRSLELLIRSRGSSATTDSEILLLRKCLRKSAVSDPADSERNEEKRGLRAGAAAAAAVPCNMVQVSVVAQHEKCLADRLPSSQIPAHHAKRQKSEKLPNAHDISRAHESTALNQASEVPKSSQEAEMSINFGTVVDDAAQATSLPIDLDHGIKASPTCDELFDDPMIGVPALTIAPDAEVPPKPSVSAPQIQPSDPARPLTGPPLHTSVSHWTSAHPGDHRAKFASNFTTAPVRGCARVEWDAPIAADDAAADERAGQDAVAPAAKRASAIHRRSSEPLPPAIEKPQNFVQVVRGGARDKLPGHGCKQCDAFYAALESALPNGQLPANMCDGSHHVSDARTTVAGIRDNASRHRAAFRKQDSPEDYWTTKFKD
jgi:hypothetical protein